MENKEAIDILRVINPPRESKRIFYEFIQARDMAIKALEKQEQVNTQSVNLTRTTYPNALESLKILESAKDENGCVPMSLVRLAFRNVLEQDRWIPVSERPKKDGKYQVTRLDYVTDTKFIDNLWYEKNTWWNRQATGDYAVTAWRSLPEPYTEKKS